MYRSITFRIDPNSSQRRFIDDSIDINCYIYNGLLVAIKQFYGGEGRLPSQMELNRISTRMWNSNEWMHRTYQNVMNDTGKRVLQAVKSCNPGLEKKKNGAGPDPPLRSPRFKKPCRYRSFGYLSNRSFAVVTYADSNGRPKRGLKLGKMEGILRCYNQRTPLPGVPKTCTVGRRCTGDRMEYFATIQCEVEDVPIGDTDKAEATWIGIDIGISKVAVLSDGTVYDNQNMRKEFDDGIRELQRKLSKATPFTSEYNKLKGRIDRRYAKLVNRRRDFIEKVSKEIAEGYDTICMEDLSVKGLRRISLSPAMTNSYNDASLGLLTRRICDKAMGAGHRVVFIDPKDTTQECSDCGNIVQKGLKVRIHDCPHCGLVMDRDLNSAINVLNRGRLATPSG
ncbi:MAG: transposase [Thermoplasmata archaeon]|nr:transposase [Thermoplasmata archaeon]